MPVIPGIKKTKMGGLMFKASLDQKTNKQNREKPHVKK
jgi:hypothetical protein